MRRWELDGRGWTRAEIGAPEPGPRDILVRVRAASLNYRDLVLLQRLKGGGAAPIAPLSDGAGVVVGTGHDVTRFAVGDRVVAAFFADRWLDGPPAPEKTAFALGGGAASGMLSELVVLHEDAWLAIPEHLSFAEAATLPCAAVTVWNALFASGRLLPGEVVLLQGTGGVSIFGLQMAKLAGAHTIITSSSDSKLDRAKSLGADETINYRATPDWDARVRELTGGRGASHILEVGGTGTLAKSVACVAAGGTITLIGGLAGFDRDAALLDQARNQGANVHPVYVGSRAMFDALNRALSLHGVHPVIDRHFAFDDALGALALMEHGGHFGKIVIDLPE